MSDEWNTFVACSKNGTFLFDRQYMDYHAHRFTDYSLVVRRENGNILALLPANLAGDTIVSHGGLTYGGFIIDRKMSVVLFLEMFGSFVAHLQSSGIRCLRYKPVPHMYHQMPAEEDLYALFHYGGRVSNVDASSTLDITAALPWSELRKRCLVKATRAKLRVAESRDFPAFMEILTDILRERHSVRPTHNTAEITLLATRFPSRIRLFSATISGEPVGGVIVYDCGQTVHAQYIAASRVGQNNGAIDAIINHVLSVFGDRLFLDLGISTESGGHHLNHGLAQQKEMFGARTNVYTTYELIL